MSNNNQIKVDHLTINKIRRRGQVINVFFHFTRNNPRTTNYFYNWIVNGFGYDNWSKAVSPIKTAWDSSKYSFDMMYGLIKAWNETQNDLVITMPEINESDEKERKIENLENQIEKLNKERQNEKDEFKQIKDNLSNTIKDLQTALGAVKEILPERVEVTLRKGEDKET